MNDFSRGKLQVQSEYENGITGKTTVSSLFVCFRSADYKEYRRVYVLPKYDISSFFFRGRTIKNNSSFYKGASMISTENAFMGLIRSVLVLDPLSDLAGRDRFFEQARKVLIPVCYGEQFLQKVIAGSIGKNIRAIQRPGHELNRPVGVLLCAHLIFL